MESFTFKTPWVLAFIPVVLVAVGYVCRQHIEATLRFSSVNLLKGLKSTWRVRGRWVLWVLRLLVLVAAITALAGPRKVLQETVVKSEGIDIVLTVDISGSMSGEDFVIDGQRVNRLEVTKNVVDQFIDARQNDQMGIIAFAGLAYTVCPLTTDYTWLKENLARIELGLIKDGTAIGSALTSAIARLRFSDAKSKVVILLTDGVNNAGEVEPITAAKAAETLGIKVYTVGVGSRGMVPYPVTDFFGRRAYRNQMTEIDEATLREIARVTNGEYFRATNTESLQEIYDEIDRLETTEIEKVGYFEHTELFHYFLTASLLLLLLEIVLRRTVLLKLP